GGGRRPGRRGGGGGPVGPRRRTNQPKNPHGARQWKSNANLPRATPATMPRRARRRAARDGSGAVAVAVPGARRRRSTRYKPPRRLNPPRPPRSVKKPPPPHRPRKTPPNPASRPSA